MASIIPSRRLPTSNPTPTSLSSCIKLPKRNVKSVESKKTMDPLLAKSNMSKTTLLAKSNMRKTTLLAKHNMRLSILNDMGVIIPDPNTMKSNATTS